MNDQAIYDDMLAYLANRHGVDVQYKDESLLMKAIGKVMVFNPGFMDQYITTIGRTVYFPKRGEESWSVLAHEAVHVLDYINRPVRFTLGYMMPQLLGALGVVAAVLATVLWNPWLLLGLVFLLALIPWPARWRLKSERRAYRVSIAAECMRWGTTSWVRSPNYQTWLADQIYSGSAYYYMTWDRARAREMVMEDVEFGIRLSTDIVDDPVLDEVSGMMESIIEQERLAS